MLAVIRSPTCSTKNVTRSDGSLLWELQHGSYGDWMYAWGYFGLFGAPGKAFGRRGPRPSAKYILPPRCHLDCGCARALETTQRVHSNIMAFSPKYDRYRGAWGLVPSNLSVWNL